MSKKHEGLVAFNHKGTDIMVTPAVHAILRSLTEETKRLQFIESKVKVIEFDNAIMRKQKEGFENQIKNLRQELNETLSIMREVKLEEALKRVDAKTMFNGFVDAIIDMQLAIDNPDSRV